MSLSDSILTLGVTLDQCLTLNSHVSAICKSSFYHIRAIRHCRASLPLDVRVTLATALVQSRLDYANSILLNTTKYNLHKLQRVQNYVARSIIPTYPPIPSAELLQNLHWLSIEDRINFKVAILCTEYSILMSQATWPICSHTTPPHALCDPQISSSLLFPAALLPSVAALLQLRRRVFGMIYPSAFVPRRPLIVLDASSKLRLLFCSLTAICPPSDCPRL